MKLANYSPNFRQVLFKIESKQTKTAGGLFIPSADFKLTDKKDFWEKEEILFDASRSNLVNYVVVKVGKDCTDTEIEDNIIIMNGISPQTIEFEEGKYYSVMEQQVIGHERAA